MWTRSIGGYYLKWLAMKRNGSEECCIISSKFSNLLWLVCVSLHLSVHSIPSQSSVDILNNIPTQQGPAKLSKQCACEFQRCIEREIFSTKSWIFW